jgi:ABC-2 type transport system permease protein
VLSALRIAGKDIRLRVRDRSAFIIGVVAPLILAVIFNLILGGAFSGSGPSLDYGLVDQDRSEPSLAFGAVLDELERGKVLTVARFDSSGEAEEALGTSIRAFFYVPSGFGMAVATGGTPEVEVIGDVDSPNATQIAASIARQFGSGVDAARLAVATTADLLGVVPDVELVESLEGDPASAAVSFQVADLAAETRQLDPATYFAAGMAIFFMFFTVQSGVVGMLEEERDGTMSRLLAAPIPRWSVVAGKGMVSLTLGVVSMSVLALATTVMMGADWGPWPGVMLLLVAAVAAGTGIAGIGGAFARTPESAGNMSSIIAVVLGLLGGVFFPLGQGDDLLARATLITPHAWFLRGLGDISGGASWTGATQAALVLLGFALVSGSIAAVALRRRLRQ